MRADAFDQVIPWLMLNRQGLTIFTHPETGEHLVDHRDRAIWMGEMLDLDLSIFDTDERLAQRPRLIPQLEFLDLAGRCLGQRSRNTTVLGALKWAMLSRQKAISSASVACGVRLQLDKGAGRFAPFLVRARDHGGLHHGGVFIEDTLDLDRGDVLAPRDDDVL